jgi:uncharacterized repeat protein (TIGR03803 family)
VLVVTIVTLVFLAPGAWAASKYKTLYKFKAGKDGRHPYASLVFDSAGSLYGTTDGGGTHKGGTAFQLTPNGDGSWKKKVLHSFREDWDGSPPHAGLILDPAGNLYGTATRGGGVRGGGTVFKLTPNGDGSWKKSVLLLFHGPNGMWPYAGLTFDAAGNLYGTTSHGGSGTGVCRRSNYGCGTVFKLTPNGDGSWTGSVLHTFNHRGKWPYAGVILDPAGNLYGTTSGGGAYGSGTVFELTPHGESVLHAFNNDGKDGTAPRAGVIVDPAGNLYGMTSGGGAYGAGTVFKLTPNGDGIWTESVLHSFNGTDGSTPYASLILDTAGNLYGTTSAGGAHSYGTVFTLVPNGDGNWTESVLYSFRNDPGAYPYAGLVFDGHGKLYGTTVGTKKGTVFEITPLSLPRPRATEKGRVQPVN